MSQVKISAFWDSDADVWVAESDDVPGLVTEAESFELLVPKLKALIPELLEANGLDSSHDVPFVLEVHEVAHAMEA